MSSRRVRRRAVLEEIPRLAAVGVEANQAGTLGLFEGLEDALELESAQELEAEIASYGGGGLKQSDALGARPSEPVRGDEATLSGRHPVVLAFGPSTSVPRVRRTSST